MRAALGITQEFFELQQLLAIAREGGFVSANLFEQPVPLVLQACQFFLELGAIPIQLQQPLILCRTARAAGKKLPEMAQPIGEVHILKAGAYCTRSRDLWDDRWDCGGKAVAALNAIIEPLVQHDV